MKNFSLLTILLLTSCVTINIYFPAAAAEKVADEIIRGIQEERSEPKQPESSQPEASLEQAPGYYRLVDTMLDFVFTSAHAAEANLDINTSGIRKLRAGMKRRFNSLNKFYANGSIGVNARGAVAIVDSKKVVLKDRNSLKKLVAAENRDRQALYAAIADANGHPDWRGQIENTFAKRWLSNVKSGWWYQSGGSWKQK